MANVFRRVRRVVQWLGPARAQGLFVLLALTGLLSLVLNAVSSTSKTPVPWVIPVQTALLLTLATYNLAPSLHVALSVACIAMYTSYAERRGTIALWLWACAIAASTMLLHQHHVVDVVTGWTLGWLGKRLIFERWSRPLPETPHPRSRTTTFRPWFETALLQYPQLPTRTQCGGSRQRQWWRVEIAV